MRFAWVGEKAQRPTRLVVGIGGLRDEALACVINKAKVGSRAEDGIAAVLRRSAPAARRLKASVCMNTQRAMYEP